MYQVMRGHWIPYKWSLHCASQQEVTNETKYLSEMFDKEERNKLKKKTHEWEKKEIVWLKRNKVKIIISKIIYL